MNDTRFLDDGDVIPKGTNIGICIYKLQRNPKIYPEPNEYKPERFSKEESEKRNFYDFFAFSGGARGCPGTQIAYTQLKIVIATVLQNFRIESKGTAADLDTYWGPVLKPKNAFIRLHCR